MFSKHLDKIKVCCKCSGNNKVFCKRSGKMKAFCKSLGKIRCSVNVQGAQHILTCFLFSQSSATLLFALSKSMVLYVFQLTSPGSVVRTDGREGAGQIISEGLLEVHKHPSLSC